MAALRSARDGSRACYDWAVTGEAFVARPFFPMGSVLYLVAVMSRIHKGLLDPADWINVNVSMIFGIHSGVSDQD